MIPIKKFVGWLRRDSEIAHLNDEIKQLKKSLSDAHWKVLKYEIEGCEPMKWEPSDFRSNFKYSEYYLLKRYGGRS